MAILKISTAHNPDRSISKLLQIFKFVSNPVNLQLGMLISSEAILRLLIHHSLTNDQMRPYFNLLLIPFKAN